MKSKFTRFKLNLIIIFILVNSLLYSNILNIKQDGTGDFTAIQAGIDEASNSDTILVYPGTYYENIDYQGKSITIASLYIITQQDSLINQTIIDGNHQGRCVKMKNCLSASIIGFTIQNGEVILHAFESYQGGGIFIYNTSNCLISDCKIRNNKAITGGGIRIEQSNVLLSNNTISYNLGTGFGGGLSFVGEETYVQFSQTELNNIYLNYSATGSDIAFGYVPNNTNVVVDTFTVQNPDYFYLTSGPEGYTFSSQHAKIEEIDQDLYVSPNGDDDNSGLAEDDPLQTIAWAQTIIKRNDDNPHTIYLAPGVYSPSLNNQIFPLNIKYGVVIEGDSPDNTILDADSQYTFFSQLAHYQEFTKLVMNNLKMSNGCYYISDSGGINIYKPDLNLDNVVIKDCKGSLGGAISSYAGYANLNNVILENNDGWYAADFVTNYNSQDSLLNVHISNSKIINNKPCSDPDFPGGGAFWFLGHPNIQGKYNAVLTNCEISGNRDASYNSQQNLAGTSGVRIINMNRVDIVNNTIGDNILDHPNYGCTISVEKSELNFYNSILYNNDGHSFTLLEDGIVNISHSLIEGGNPNIYYYYPLAIVNWLDGNLLNDPQWDTNGENPYALTNNSPCIDAGTLDLPEGVVLPETDLAGNPRIYGDTIDMGAYEWQGPDGNTNDSVQPIEKSHILNFPNPFGNNGGRNGSGTNVKLYLEKEGDVDVSIYNIRGQKVITILKGHCAKGEYSNFWNGRNENNKRVSSGQYFIKLSVDGEVQFVKKCLLLK